MLSTLLLAVATAAAIAPSPVASLDPDKAIAQFVLDSWSTEDGLPQNTVRAIWQSPDGYLWLGTGGGLVRFNGLEFKVYDTDPAFSSVRIIALGEDALGQLWVGTNDGIVIMEGSVARPLPLLPPRTQVSTFLQDGGSGMLVGTFNAGLYRCTEEICSQIEFEELGEVQSVVRSQEETWVGTSQGLFTLREGILTLVEGTGSFKVSSMTLDDEDRLLVATQDDPKLYRESPDGSFELLEPASGWPVERVYSMLRDQDHSVWMGLQSNGVVRYTGTVASRSGENRELPGTLVLALYQDREGSVWVGTEGGGLLRFRDGAFTTLDSASGLSDEYVTTLFQDGSGVVWAGTFGGGVNRIDPETLEFLAETPDLPSQNITGIIGDGSGTVWVASIDAGVTEIRNGVARAIGPLPSQSVYALHVDNTRRLWIGTDEGLASYSNGQVKSLTMEDGLGSNSIVSIEDDGAGTLWVGTEGGGLTQFKDDVSITYNTESGLGSDIISALHLDDQGVLWIGTLEGGLSLLVNDQIRTFSVRDGLYDDTIFQILEDDHGYIWMGSNKGITRVEKEAVHEYSAGIRDIIPHESFGRDDGLKSFEFNGGTGPAGWKSSDGRLWFPTVAGVAVVDPSDLSRNTMEPPVVIEQIDADGVRIQKFEDVTFLPGTRRIEFTFAALSLIDPSAIQYRYRLEEDESEWTHSDFANTATYTFLNPGRHTFQVVASNNDGLWNEEGASVSFYLKPYFYQTSWFWMLTASLGLILSAFAIRIRTKQVKLQRERLESMVEDRTRDVMAAKDQIEAQSEALRDSLKEKEVLLREVHHRVKNNLQMISSLLQLQARQVDDPETKVRFAECRDRIYSFSMVHERLYMAKDMARFDFVMYITGLAQQLVRSLDFGGDNIQLSVEIAPIEMNVDSAIQCGLVTTELITNALRHAFDPGESGMILVEFRHDRSACVLSVEDDGRGLSHDFETNSHEGLGLKLVDALVTRLRGTLTSHRVMTGGTRFEVRFPIGDVIAVIPSEVEIELA